MTNKTATTITDSDWFLPTALNNEGGSARVCYYSPPNIPPGQTARATFVAYIELNQFVARITQKIRNTTYVRCLDSANPPREVSC